MRVYANIYLIAYVFFIAALFIIPMVSWESYSLIKNTLSELGAQQMPANGFVNFSIILLSLAIALFGTKRINFHFLQLAILYAFSTSFLFTGIYQMAGFDTQRYVFDYTDDALHSVFISLTGIAFNLFCFLYIFILKKKKHKWETIVVLAFSLLMISLMFLFPEYKGINQRILFLVAFGWLFYALATYPLKQDHIRSSSR